MVICLSPNGPMVHATAAAASRLLVATKRGVAILDPGPATAEWRVMGVTLEGRHVSALLFEPSARRVLAATHGDGIFASTDSGETWTGASNGLTLENVFSLGSSVHEAGTTLLAGTEPVMLFSSVDGGRSWRPHPLLEQLAGRDKWTFPAPPHVAHLKSIAVHPAEPNVYYACIEQGALLKSDDAGATWRELSAYARPDDRWYRDIHKIVPSASDSRRLFMTTGVGVYASTDAGASWRKLTDDDFPIGYPDHLIISPRDESVVYVAGASTSPDIWRQTGVAKAMVLCSRDGGVHWQLASDGLPVSGRAAIEAMSIAIESERFTLFVGNTDGEVYVSHDEAGSWKRIASGLAPVSKAMHANYVT